MVSGRYWSHMTKFPFRVFGLILISHIQDFQELSKWIFRTFRAHLFQNIHFVEFQEFEISQNSIFQRWFVIVLELIKVLGVSKDKWYWFWDSWSRPRGPNTMKIMTCPVLQKWNRKATNPNWRRIILRSFWTTLSLKCMIKWSPDPPEPKSGFSLDFQRIFVILRGTIMFQDLNDSTNWSSPNTKIPRPSKHIHKYPMLFNIIFDLIRLTCVLKIWGFQRFIKIPPSYLSVLIQSDEIEDCFGPTDHNSFKCWCSHGLSKTLKYWISRILRYAK